MGDPMTLRLTSPQAASVSSSVVLIAAIGPLDYLVVNRETTDSMLQAWVFDLRAVDPEIIVLPVPGSAYLTRSRVDISGPVPGP